MVGGADQAYTIWPAEKRLAWMKIHMGPYVHLWKIKIPESQSYENSQEALWVESEIRGFMMFQVQSHPKT